VASMKMETEAFEIPKLNSGSISWWIPKVPNGEYSR
jgi:hypothetical protein